MYLRSLDLTMTALMEFLPLLYYIHVTVLIYCHHWAAAASPITCEAVSRGSSADPSCHQVGDCIEAATPGDNSESGVQCLEDKPCPSSPLSDGAAVNYNSTDNETDKEYSIEGLPRFNGSNIGYCPSAPHPLTWQSAPCIEGRDLSYTYSRVLSLTINYRPIDARYYEAIVEWSYPDNVPEAVKALKLNLYGPGIRYPGYCVCIERSLSLREYSLVLEYNAAEQYDAVVQMVMFPIPKYYDPKNPPRMEKNKQFPTNCTDYSRGLPRSSSSCGRLQYGRPRNVQVHKSAFSTALSWDKPCFLDSNACNFVGMDSSESEPDTYYLTTTVRNATTHFVVYNSTEVTLSTADAVDFKLYTHTPCSGMCEVPFFSNSCSTPATSPGEVVDNDTCCVSDSSTSSTSVQPTVTSTPKPRDKNSSPTNHGQVILPVAVVVALAMIVIVVILSSLLCYKCHSNGNVTDEIPLIKPSSTPCPVLVVFSHRTTEREAQTILRYLVSDLTASPYCIESSTYGIGHLRQSLSEWMVERHREANAVLCVCNREFFEDWTGTCPDTDGSPQVVRTLKHLFEGDLQRMPSGTKNFAVILMRATDDQFIPPLLKSRQAFMYHQVDEIARFSCNVQKFLLQTA